MYSTKKKRRIQISLITPLFNEEERIENLKILWNYVKNKPYFKELIVVNDGSKDRTLSLIKKYKKEIHINVISYSKNRGKGYAIRRGIEQAKGSHVVFMDIDLSTPPETIVSLTKVIAQKDIIIGTRKNKKAVLLKHQSFIREHMGMFFTWLSQHILAVYVSDFTCGFKCFSKETAQKIFAKQRIQRWAFDSEALFLAKKYGFSVGEIPVRWMDQRGTKVRFPQDAFYALVDLFKIRINDMLGKY